MKEHRCINCNKLLFKYSDNGEVSQGKIEIETQHHCKALKNEKMKDVKVFKD